jgi:hypothetical protein
MSDMEVSLYTPMQLYRALKKRLSNGYIYFYPGTIFSDLDRDEHNNPTGEQLMRMQRRINDHIAGVTTERIQVHRVENGRVMYSFIDKDYVGDENLDVLDL